MGYEYLYKGTPYSLEPGYGSVFTGYRIPAGELGATTSIQTANQIREVTNLLNQGIKNVEVSAINQEVLDMIPKQHLKEINRLTKLTGSETTLHGPLVEASGYAKEGWSEGERQQAENQIKGIIEKAHELSPEGNIPVTFHSTAMLPEGEEKMMTKEGEAIKSLYIVDPRTGKVDVIRETKKYFPEEGHAFKPEEERVFNPEEELKRINKDAWVENVGNINQYAYRGHQIITEIENLGEKTLPHFAELEGKKLDGMSLEEIGKLKEKYFKTYADKENFKNLSPEHQNFLERQFRELEHGEIFLKDAYRGMRSLYNMAYQSANPEDRKKLNEFGKNISPFVERGLERNPEKLREFAELVEKGIKVLNSVQPQIYQKLDEFVVDKSSETFANSALNAYKKFGENAPIISIENPPAGSGLSRAEDLKKLIQETRRKFVEKAKEEGMSAKEADNVSKKIIGATWDTSHISMLRKMGYDEKDMIEQAKTIAPFVKHVHYNDNFGSSHTDLPPGMGSMPMKEIMQELDKAGFKGKKIFEGGAFFQHFQASPHTYVMEGSGSPLYSMKAPYWNQMPAYGNYFALPSAYLPESHFTRFGGGFSDLPPELGGIMPGKQSRASGTPMD